MIFFQVSNIPLTLIFAMEIGFLFDMLININTGYLDKGNVILDRSLSMHFYFRKNFIYDILTLVPLFFIHFGFNSENPEFNIFIQSLVIFKWNSLIITLTRLETYFTF